MAAPSRAGHARLRKGDTACRAAARRAPDMDEDARPSAMRRICRVIDHEPPPVELNCAHFLAAGGAAESCTGGDSVVSR